MAVLNTTSPATGFSNPTISHETSFRRQELMLRFACVILCWGLIAYSLDAYAVAGRLKLPLGCINQ